MAIEIPRRMRHLPLDRRGYPVPVIVARRPGHEPAFSVNDVHQQARVVAEDVCSICDGKLARGRWLVGGCLSMIAENGVSYDEMMHDECLHYALKVCPYMATPRWNGSVAKQQAKRIGVGLTFDIAVDDAARPVAFVAVMSVNVHVYPVPGSPVEGMNFFRPRPGSVRKVEVWKDGRQLEGDDLAAFREHVARQLAKHEQQPRLDVWRMIGGA